MFDTKTWHKKYYQIHKEQYRQSHIRYRNTEGGRLHEKEYGKNNQYKHWRRQISFKGKTVCLSFPVRLTGQCSHCNRKRGEGFKSTIMHHSKGYFTIFPWFGIEEICRRCHLDEHPYVRVLGGQA